MGTKKSQGDLQKLRLDIIDAAKQYKNFLVCKRFLYVYGDNYFEVLFQADQFLHLTGVSTPLNAQQFFNYACNRRLTTYQFFTKKGYKTAYKKVLCLKHLMDLTNQMVFLLFGIQTQTCTYDIGINNLECTLGLTEIAIKPDKNSERVYIPRTLRIKDKSIENSNNGEIVDFIFVRDVRLNNKYNCMLYADKNKSIPNTINHLIDSKFYAK